VVNVTEQVWKEYHTKLHNFIQNRVGDTSRADDILQEVFLRIHSRIDTLKDRGKIQNWIYQITRNAIIDYYRAQKQMEQLPEALAAPEADPNNKASKEIESCLLPMIQSLPEHYRRALILSEIEGFTQKEVAAKQELSISGAKSRVHRGRNMVKDMLLQCCHFEFDRRGRVLDYQKKGASCSQCGIDV
jgi:RNA polymerase sigma-70 factor (ECF subfamily)